MDTKNRGTLILNFVELDLSLPLRESLLVAKEVHEARVRDYAQRRPRCITVEEVRECMRHEQQNREIVAKVDVWLAQLEEERDDAARSRREESGLLTRRKVG